VILMDVFWLEQKEADVPIDDDWLSVDEVLRVSGMRFAKRRADWRLGRWTAKNAVASYLHLHDPILSLAEIEIRSAQSGAPEVFLANNPAAVTISLTHRDGTAACAIAPPAVALGCDLEIIEPHSDAFLTDYFTAEEQALVAHSTDRNPLLAVLWSAKESALKALGAGLRLDTRRVVVRPNDAGCEPDGWHSLQARHTSGEVFHGWWQQTGKLVRTLVSNPASTPPILLGSQLERSGTSHQESAAVLPA
jgi:4'-phosphopantetheinyl transferase